MYITAVPNRGSNPTILLRESYREDGKVKNKTLANLSKLPPEAVDAVKRVLSGETLVPASEAFEIVRTVKHGHADVALKAIRKLGLDRMISSRKCKERDLVLSMLAMRLFGPGSKLKTARNLITTSLPRELGLGDDVSEDDLYRAMDWVFERQGAIEKKLANKHLKSGGLVLYDLTSTWVEGEQCPLAKRGYSRDGKQDKLQVNFGLVTDDDGRPISVSVYAGNTADPATVQDQVRKLKEDFGIERVVFVGDRGMVTQTRIDSFIEQGDIDWISALKSVSLRKLRTEGVLQLGLFDETNLFEFKSEHYPKDRLVACRNEELMKRRANKRQSLIAATKKELEKIKNTVRSGRLRGKDNIGVRVGRVINKHKVAKHFKLNISDQKLGYRVRTDSVEAEAALDGIYVIRTSVSAEAMSAEDTVRNYKRLAHVEKSFRAMKTIDLKVRPIYHYAENRVRAHIFLCMLAYYVEWHLRHVWKSLLFANEVDTLFTRDPVKPAKPTAQGRRKARTKKTEDGFTVHSFGSLLDHLSTIAISTCRRPGAPEGETWDMPTQPDALQRRAFQLLGEL